MSPTVGPGKTKVSREIKEILGPLKEALSHYQQALPKYMEAMKQKFPHRPPIDLDCNERRIRESLAVLKDKLQLAMDVEATRRREREEELRVKAEIIANREEIPNPYRSLLREMESTTERLRNTQKQIQTHWKQMAEKRTELDEMQAWLKSGEPASKEMLRSIGLLKGSASKGETLSVGKSSEAPLFRATPSSKLSCSTRSFCRAMSPISSASSKSSRHSSTVDDPHPEMSSAGSCCRRAVTFKTRRPVKKSRAPTTRAEYCPVGNKVSFRKATHVTSRTDSVAKSTKTDGDARARRATSAEPKRTTIGGIHAKVTLPERPKTAGDTRRSTMTNEAPASTKPQDKTMKNETTSTEGKQRPSRTKSNFIGTLRSKEKTGRGQKVKKKPPWRPMA